jgi:hypothetical protein
MAMKTVLRRAAPYVVGLVVAAVWLAALAWRQGRGENGPWRVVLEHAVYDSEIDWDNGVPPLAIGVSASSARELRTAVAWPEAHSAAARYGVLSANGQYGDRRGDRIGPYMLDQSAPSTRGYDVLCIDLNNDGKIGPGERLSGKPLQLPSQFASVESRWAVDYGVAPVQSRGEGHLCHVRLFAIGYAVDTGRPADADLAWLAAAVGCCKQGYVRFCGRNEIIRIFDTTLDRRIAVTHGRDPQEADMIKIGAAVPVPLAPIVVCRGRLLEVEIGEGGNSVTLREYAEPKGRLRVTSAVREGELGPLSLRAMPLQGRPIEFESASPAGARRRGEVMPAKGFPIAFQAGSGDVVELPTGRYQVEIGLPSLKTREGEWIAVVNPLSLTIEEGKESRLAVGAPMKVGVELGGRPAPGGTVSIGCRILGASGEEYAALQRIPNGPGGLILNVASERPVVIVRNGAGQKLADAAMESG